MNDRKMPPAEALPRLLRLLALIGEDPGIGFADLKEALKEETGRDWGRSTLLKDIRSLKDLALLADIDQRDGYFLRGSAFRHAEVRVLLRALRMRAEDLGDPLAQDLQSRLRERLKEDPDHAAAIEYPAEAIGNRAVVDTQSPSFKTIMQGLSGAIARGQEITLRRARNPNRLDGELFDAKLFPLQLIFHDIAWYLLAEDTKQDGSHFMALRVDRYHPEVRPTDRRPRGAQAQAESLKQAKAWLALGWGMAIPNPFDTRDPTANIELELVFLPGAAGYILENKNRHPTQRFDHSEHPNLIMRVRLPRQGHVLREFRRWVLTWGPLVELRGPLEERREMARLARSTAARYQDA